MSKKIWAVVALGIIAIAAAGGAIYLRQKTIQPKPQVCTQEAKLCPDGFYVSRTGPNCEFVACPEIKNGTTGQQNNNNSIINSIIKDLANNPEKYLNKEVEVSGILVLTSGTFWPSPEFGISDGTSVFPVTPWLPFEVERPINGNTSGQPGSMQDYVGRGVTLKGIVKKENGYYLEVEDGKLLDNN